MAEEKKRLCLFAGFDKRGEIAEYVVYYIKALSKIADVYYWGDFETSEQEKNKLKPYCKKVFCAPHAKYDFGSWQELIEEIGRKKIESYDELILANDSCYGPLSDLSELFQEMDERDCDFWGLSLALLKHIHLQSYFIVLKKSVIQSDVFYNFFRQVRVEEKYSDVCARYEDRFTYTLSKAGFRFCSLIDYNDLENHPYKDIMSAIRNRHFPFLKVKFFLGDIRDQAGVPNWRREIFTHTNYPVRIIEDDLARRGFNLKKIDHDVRKKKSGTLGFHKRSILMRILRKSLSIVLKPIIPLMDAYIGDRTAQFAYKTDHLSREYRRLRQENDRLQTRIGANSSKQGFRIEQNNKKCDLQPIRGDVCIIRHFDLAFPLTHESRVLIIGNISLHNLASLELYEPTTVFLNNDFEEELGIESVKTNNLCNFSFKDANNHKVYFDFILAQPINGHATKQEIRNFIANLKDQMIFESVLVLLVDSKEKEQYEEIAQDEGLCLAGLQRGLVVQEDPFRIYYDKIGSTKGYKALIYKIK